MAMGHIRQQYKEKNSIQETKPTDTQPELIHERTNKIFLKIMNLKHKVYTDQTGRFSVTSSKGDRYTMVAYEYDSKSYEIPSRTSTQRCLLENLNIIRQTRTDTKRTHFRL